MSRSDSQPVSRIATRAGAPAPSIQVDLEDVRPLALPGGTVVFSQSYRETPHGAHVSAGEVPVCVAGVYSPTDLRSSLASLGFDSAVVMRALRHSLSGETATKAVRVAERETGNVEVLA